MVVAEAEEWAARDTAEEARPFQMLWTIVLFRQDATARFPPSVKAAPPLSSESASALQPGGTERRAAWGAGVGAAEDFPIKAGIPRPAGLVSPSIPEQPRRVGESSA
ncbi:hypothetical protein VZT92_012361 [Zoarces viviparus]|uniref:Uncharacterized protein n=1 Tax=Zoarces viviparus TaxID=48416 RepID=A0AAW1F8K2_ZOAVI